MAKRPYAFTLIAYVDEVAAGLVNCFEQFSTFACKPLINIHDVVVLKQHRGRGISKRMLEQVEQIALEKDCCKLTLEVLTGNAVARSAYQGFGFSSYQLSPETGSAEFWQKLL
ncbi:MAG: GNAT family N-acetyltransferase [Immundisolibacteraceae bacterium]|nr:GNAT family N-acetyltransferase [Immundisolibacteraceae bacterium]